MSQWVANRTPEPPHPFSHTVSNDQWVLVSGVGGHDADGKAVILMHGPTPYVNQRGEGNVVQLLWITNESPVDLSHTRDQAAQKTGVTKPATSTPNASVTSTSRKRNPACWTVRGRITGSGPKLMRRRDISVPAGSGLGA